MRVGRLVVALWIVSAVSAATGCGSEPTRAAPPELSAASSTPSTTVPVPPYRSFIATARSGVNPVPVATSPGGPAVATPVPNPNENGVPAVFLVKERNVVSGDGVWHRVFLPTKPNGSQGWVRDADVTITYTDFELVIRLAEYRIELLDAGQVVRQYPIGVGTAQTPTPGGVFYVKELLQPTNIDGAYGPYAYGLSGFSNSVLDERFGDGVIGVHGTNEPNLVGTDVSHGCIRLKNEDILDLVAQQIPLGTPVRILA